MPHPHHARRTIIAISVLSCATCFAGLLFAQNGSPDIPRGVTTKVLGNIDLNGQINDIAGRQLRARLATMEPGGHLPVHNHAGRPTLEYILQGTVIEVRNGVEIPHKAGDVVIATHDVSHGWENRSTAQVMLLPVDIYKP
ncbi:cupin domain-containing protein [Massilia sp. R2A-15]|uniref:cupin domain-containing protein n=1 Tax=Massilia sp. R2A-15 TaxID=3064278 RepID=UPI0027328D95|nr:cupin domain-containing protein [Massilia sp. R2A-15]WLI91155.1 cupin domain-containing protein [Massilia sp. R2A-15]